MPMQRPLNLRGFLGFGNTNCIHRCDNNKNMFLSTHQLNPHIKSNKNIIPAFSKKELSPLIFSRKRNYIPEN